MSTRRDSENGESIWAHDAWQRIYAINDPATQAVVAHLYRLILNMHDSDILAQKVAAAVHGRDRLTMTIAQKVFAFCFSVVIATDTIVRLWQATHHH